MKRVRKKPVTEKALLRKIAPAVRSAAQRVSEAEDDVMRSTEVLASGPVTAAAPRALLDRLNAISVLLGRTVLELRALSPDRKTARKNADAAKLLADLWERRARKGGA